MRYEFSDCVLDVDRHVLLRGGEPVPVEPQVFDLLELLAQNPGRLVAREDIVEKVWNGRFVSDSTISARVAAARKAVGDNGKAQRVIRTIVRRGLQMAAEVSQTPAKSDTIGPVQQVRYARSRAGRSIPFTLTGKGPPLLRVGSVIHDLEAEWRLAFERKRLSDFADSFRLLRYDKDHGASSITDQQAVYDIRVDEILAVAKAAKFDRFAILGEMGGTFPALHFAAEYPERVSKLILAGGWAEGRDHRNDATEPDSIRTLIAEGWHTPGSGYAMSSSLSYFPDGPLEDVRKMVSEMQALYSPEQKLKYRDIGNSTSALHLLPQIRCPTLILHGRNAAVHPLSEARKLAAGISNASLMILETANQIPLPSNEAYPVYLQAVRSFLKADG